MRRHVPSGIEPVMSYVAPLCSTTSLLLFRLRRDTCRRRIPPASYRPSSGTVPPTDPSATRWRSAETSVSVWLLPKVYLAYANDPLALLAANRPAQPPERTMVDCAAA